MTGEKRNRAQAAADPGRPRRYVRPWMLPALAAGIGLVVSAIPIESNSAFKPDIMWKGPSFVDFLGPLVPLSEPTQRMAVGVAVIYWVLGLLVFLTHLFSTHKEERRNRVAELLLMLSGGILVFLIPMSGVLIYLAWEIGGFPRECPG